MDFRDYDLEGCYDEMFLASGEPRPATRYLAEKIAALPPGELERRQKAAEAAFLQLGITFTVYGEEQGVERIFPFDTIPRVVEAREWEQIERGLKQRIFALNQFIHDIYHDQKIVKDKVVPAELIHSGTSYRPECAGLNPPKGIWCHITGSDLVRDRDGRYYVLEDNLRVPSGVSYVLENRQILKRTFPKVFEKMRVRAVEDYPNRLLEMLNFIAPVYLKEASIGVLTPGMYNSAYFEHSFLARQMGAELVEGGDLTVSDGYLFKRTTRGFQKVDVLYRRVDDDFLDPRVFRSDSRLGVPGLMEVYRAGRVALANAPGTGIADDKAIYSYVPKIIRYYMGADPILPNVPTYLCAEEGDRAYVLENLDKLVVKAANESGGYGMLVGPHATVEHRAAFAERIKANPRNYIAQPTLSLSRVPILCGDHFEGRHVDLRPYVLFGKDIHVIPGGLTRVALRKGSLVVNSSQGGGSKDTWVLESDPAAREREQAQAQQQQQQ
ncbi:MAG: circularly permuted type 2 ATP-grasp protein [Planctomycetota bacterium]